MFNDADRRIAELARRQHHGWRPLRFTWKMLHQEVEWVWAKVAGARHHAVIDAGRAA